jgi:hypothetical protein
MKKKIILLVLLLASLAALRYPGSEAQVLSGDFPMNVTIPLNFIQVSLSNKLAQGITFTTAEGSVQNLERPLLAGSAANNATFNYDKVNLKSDYWVTISGMMVDVCNGAKYSLCSNLTCVGFANEEIKIGNVTWSNAFTSDFSTPSQVSAVPMVLGYDNAHKLTKINPGTTIYLRYWQSVPANFPAFNYSTVYQIQVVPTGASCE